MGAGDGQRGSPSAAAAAACGAQCERALAFNASIFPFCRIRWRLCAKRIPHSSSSSRLAAAAEATCCAPQRAARLVAPERVRLNSCRRRRRRFAVWRPRARDDESIMACATTKLRAGRVRARRSHRLLEGSARACVLCERASATLATSRRSREEKFALRKADARRRRRRYS